MNCVLIMMNRYRLTFQSIHAILSVYENISDVYCMMVSVFSLCMASFHQFERLVKDKKEDGDELKTVGRRILNTMFNIWPQQIYAKLTTMVKVPMAVQSAHALVHLFQSLRTCLNYMLINVQSFTMDKMQH